MKNTVYGLPNVVVYMFSYIILYHIASSVKRDKFVDAMRCVHVC